MVQFLRGMLGFDVSRVQPHRVSDFEVRDGQSTVQGVKLIPLDGMLELALKVLVQLLEVCSHFVSMLRQNRLEGTSSLGWNPLLAKKGVIFMAECVVLLYANSARGRR